MAKFTREVQYTSSGDPMCSAKLSDGGFCQDTNVAGNGRCRRHGGATPKGQDHWSYRGGGRHWKHLRESYLAPYQDGMEETDVEQLSVSSEIALIDALIKMAVSRMDAVGSAEVFARIVKQFDKFAESFMESDDELEVRRHFQHLADAVDEGKQEGAAREEIKNLTEQRRRLVETESKTRERLVKSIPVQLVKSMILEILNVVGEEVKDVSILEQIADRAGGIVEGIDQRGVRVKSSVGRPRQLASRED